MKFLILVSIALGLSSHSLANETHCDKPEYIDRYQTLEREMKDLLNSLDAKCNENKEAHNNHLKAYCAKDKSGRKDEKLSQMLFIYEAVNSVDKIETCGQVVQALNKIEIIVKEARDMYYSPSHSMAPGSYYLESEGGFIGASIDVKADGTYLFQQVSVTDAMNSACTGTYTFKDNVFEGKVDCSGVKYVDLETCAHRAPKKHQKMTHKIVFTSEYFKEVLNGERAPVDVYASAFKFKGPKNWFIKKTEESQIMTFCK